VEVRYQLQMSEDYRTLNSQSDVKIPVCSLIRAPSVFACYDHSLPVAMVMADQATICLAIENRNVT